MQGPLLTAGRADHRRSTHYEPSRYFEDSMSVYKPRRHTQTDYDNDRIVTSWWWPLARWPQLVNELHVTCNIFYRCLGSRASLVGHAPDRRTDTWQTTERHVTQPWRVMPSHKQCYSPPIDIIRAMMIVWRQERKIIINQKFRTIGLCCISVRQLCTMIRTYNANSS